MDGVKAYKYYMAIKLHFTSEKFNVFENKGAIKGTREKIQSRNDYYIFDKLGRRFSTDKEYIQYIASNFMYGNHDVVYNVGYESESLYKEYIKRKQSITKVFADDCHTIINELDKINFTNNQLPYIISLYLANRITLETVRILDDKLNIIQHLKLKNQMVYKMFEDSLRIIEKSKGFVKYNKDKTDMVYEDIIGDTEII